MDLKKIARFKAVFFDLDGTLFDTAPDIIAACNYTLQNFGFLPCNEAILRTEVMNGMCAMLRAALPPSHQHMAQKNTPMYNFFSKYYTEHTCVLTTPYAGVEKLINELHKNGIRIALISNKYCSMIKALFKHFSFTKYFEVITGGDSCTHAKPHPEPLLTTLKLMNLNSQDVLYCGDAPSDIEASFHAGCASCAVKWGYGRFDNSFKFTPDYTALNCDDLLDIIFKTFNKQEFL